MPGSGEALLELGEALIGLSDIDQAVPLLRKLLEQEPSHVRGRVANLWVRLARGEFDELNMDIYDLTQDMPKTQERSSESPASIEPWATWTMRICCCDVQGGTRVSMQTNYMKLRVSNLRSVIRMARTGRLRRRSTVIRSTLAH